MRLLLLIAAIVFSTPAWATEGKWCGDDLPYSFVMDGENLLIVRMNQTATCKPKGSGIFLCSEKWPGFKSDRYEVNAFVNSDGNLVFANKGEKPATYKECA